MIDFSIFYKKRILLRDLAMDSFDLFISCFDKSERVQKVFENVRASSKKWLISPRYAFSPGELPDDNFQLLEADESTFIKTFFDGVGDLTQKKICVDITGFLKPELLFIF
ncbi:MAG TPA: hypothetical protein VNX68_03895, partial [Nitrosopumilaceae archaeon]|nr:hypothetical protein [Nitrosopumilaceae archaeon]